MLPFPPAPAADDITLWLAAGGCIVVGALLTLLGYVLGRAFVTLAMAAGGWLIGAFLVAPTFGMNASLVGFVLLAAGAMLGVVLNRIIWALLAAGVAGCAALLAAIGWVGAWGQWPAWQAEAPGLWCWLAALVQWVVASAAAAWSADMVRLSAPAAGAALAPLVVGLIWPRPIQILMTALLGSALMVAGVVLAVLPLRPTIWATAVENWHVPAIIAGVAMLLGLLWQFRAAAASDKRAAGKKKKTDEAAAGKDGAGGKPPSGGPKDKKPK
jgi:hypothetical protein